MNRFRPAFVIVSALAMAFVLACGGEKPIDVKTIMAQPRLYVGSDTCKMCHLEHYDSWEMTLHSRMTQDAQKNKDVIIADFDEKRIREDLANSTSLKSRPTRSGSPRSMKSSTPSAASGSSGTSWRKTGSSTFRRYSSTPTRTAG